MGSNTPTVVLVIVVLVAAGIIGLICSSYSDLEFYQMGFKRSKTTGTVDTSQVYLGGRQWIGPDKNFKIFDASAHYITLDDISVFAAQDSTSSIPDVEDSSSGASLAIVISVHIAYFLVQQDLKLLHDEYDVNYESLVTNSAKAAIKDTASLFSLSEFYKNREYVENELLAGVQLRLGGVCCSPSCQDGSANYICLSNCVHRDQCTTNQKGVFVEARYLQLTDLVIPYSVEQRNLKTIIIVEETAKETYNQQAAVIEKQTEQLVEEILNSATEVTANATSQSRLIDANSQANYQKILEGARREGLVTLFNTINLTTIEHKNSFDYLRSLADNEKAHLTVDYDQLITGPTKLP